MTVFLVADELYKQPTQTNRSSIRNSSRPKLSTCMRNTIHFHFTWSMLTSSSVDTNNSKRCSEGGEFAPLEKEAECFWKSIPSLQKPPTTEIKLFEPESICLWNNNTASECQVLFINGTWRTDAFIFYCFSVGFISMTSHFVHETHTVFYIRLFFMLLVYVIVRRWLVWFYLLLSPSHPFSWYRLPGNLNSSTH